MIEKHYFLKCDKCSDWVYLHNDNVRHITTLKALKPMLRASGWETGKKKLLCPACVREKLGV